MTRKECELIQLVMDYIACSKYACNLLKGGFSIKENTLLRARKINLIPKEGVLPDGFNFSFHGGGCYFKFENGAIDVDFGPNDRCDGFDSQRLYEFLTTSKKKYGHLQSMLDIQKSLDMLLAKGVIISPGWIPGPHLFYLGSSIN